MKKRALNRIKKMFELKTKNIVVWKDTKEEIERSWSMTEGGIRYTSRDVRIALGGNEERYKREYIVCDLCGGDLPPEEIKIQSATHEKCWLKWVAETRDKKNRTSAYTNIEEPEYEDSPRL